MQDEANFKSCSHVLAHTHSERGEAALLEQAIKFGELKEGDRLVSVLGARIRKEYGELGGKTCIGARMKGMAHRVGERDCVLGDEEF